ncbi:MAG: YdcF family protein [Thiohalocapsa sp.]
MEALFSYGVFAPPGVFIVLSLAGALLALRWRRMGIALALASSLALYAAATPAVSSSLLRQVETGLPDRVDLGGAQAIVVLGGDVRRGDGGAIPDRLGPISLERVVAAAQAYRRLQLPVAVSGGRVGGARTTEAALLQQALDADFAVPVRWVEDRSRTTWENAVFTAALLRPAQVTTVVLVTQAWHLPRAIWSFERAGLHALPWPMPRTALHRDRAGDFLPSVVSLLNSFFALHEMIGAAYYRLRH